MQTVVAYLLILIGIAMEVISVLAWLKVITPVGEIRALCSVTFWGILLELTRRAPWPAVVGLLMIYAGLKLLGVPLPFQTEENCLQTNRPRIHSEACCLFLTLFQSIQSLLDFVLTFADIEQDANIFTARVVRCRLRSGCRSAR